MRSSRLPIFEMSLCNRRRAVCPRRSWPGIAVMLLLVVVAIAPTTLQALQPASSDDVPLTIDVAADTPPGHHVATIKIAVDSNMTNPSSSRVGTRP